MSAGFITFEGGEGSGKSTQARRLGAYLAGKGMRIVETREPGGSPFAERLRAFILDPAIPAHAPLAEALLFYAARSDHLAQIIKPALASGAWVVCDRFSDSTRVYQGLVGGLDPQAIDTLERLVVGTAKPDLTILLDIDPAVGLARAEQRRLAGANRAPASSDAYEARDLEFHRRLREGFLDLARVDCDRIQVLDGALEPDILAAAIQALVDRRFGAT